MAKGETGPWPLEIYPRIIAPMVPQLICFFLRTRVITMYAWGLGPLFGNGNLFPKKIGPKKIIQDKFGYSPPYAPQTWPFVVMVMMMLAQDTLFHQGSPGPRRPRVHSCPPTLGGAEHVSCPNGRSGLQNEHRIGESLWT